MKDGKVLKLLFAFRVQAHIHIHRAHKREIEARVEQPAKAMRS
jgi:hypothetical protein